VNVPRRPQRPQFPRCWISPAARQAIEILWQDPENDRDVLQRFAIHPLMYTDVWEKLPCEPESMAGEVIRCAMVAIRIFPMLRPMPRTGRREALERWDQFRRKHLKHPLDLPDTSYAWSATELRDAVARISDATWSRHWRGPDRAHVIAILDAVARSFQSMGEENEALLAMAQFPLVQRWDDPRAPERFFREWMSSLLERMYGRRFDPVVAALTNVAFKRDDVSAETVRWRRRTDRRK
jgi:hypothetical protein